MNFAALKRELLRWPGVEEGTSWGKPSLKAFGKFLTRLTEDGDSIVVPGIPFDEREMLIEADGAVFHFTEHYRNVPTVLMRLSKAKTGAAEALLRRHWRRLAPKKLRDADTAAI